MGAIEDLAEVGCERRIGWQAPQAELGVADDASQQVVEVVRHAAGKSTHDLPGAPRPQWGFGQQVHVFDWQGNLVGALRLEERVNHFAVNTTTNQIYGIRYDPDSALFEFERPDPSLFKGVPYTLVLTDQREIASAYMGWVKNPDAVLRLLPR